MPPAFSECQRTRQSSKSNYFKIKETPDPLCKGSWIFVQQKTEGLKKGLLRKAF